ncbi:MAG: hypothetical protein NVS9B14_22540 [Candidatus Acidiferrum sp.]
MILILAGIGAASFALLATGRFMKGRSPAPAEGAAVGIPAIPFSILKPFFSRIPATYFDVSTSWKPSSL